MTARSPKPYARSAPSVAGMRMKIGVMGSSGPPLTRPALRSAHALGVAAAVRSCVLVTGACPGLPLTAAEGAKSMGGMVIGISPASCLADHIQTYRSPVEWHDVLIFTGIGRMGREFMNIRSSDIVVIIGGRSGTLGELAIAYDEGKPIGVLTGNGGITDLIPEIIRACHKQTGAQLVYDTDPDRLLDRLISRFGQRASQDVPRARLTASTRMSSSGSKNIRPGSRRR